MNDRVWMGLGAGFYALALLIAAWGLLGRRGRSVRPLQFATALTGFLCQTVGLHLRGLEVHSCPIGNPFEMLQFISWSTMLIYLLTGTVFRLSLLGGFTVVMAGALSLLSFLGPSWDHAYPAGGLFGGNPWIEAHASIALLSYGFFGMLAVSSAMYLLQHFGLKTKRTKGIYAALPSILQLETLSQRLLLVGCVGYTLSIVIGSVAWSQDWGAVFGPKLGATFLLWLAYLFLLVMRWRGVWRGPRAAWWGMCLFGAALLALWPVEAGRQVGSDGIGAIEIVE
jgi:ABC-type uncharacterized transport system permease subunit